jgi:hypothetical protein
MKTTLEIPDQLFRKARSFAAEKGIPLRELVSEALAEKLGGRVNEGKPWMKSFGKLRSMREETKRVEKVIQQTFERIDAEYSG